VDDRVERVARKRMRRLDVVEERARAERQLEDVVQTLCAGAHAEQLAELTEAAAGQSVSRGQVHILGGQAFQDRANAVVVLRIARVERAVLLPDALVRRAVDVVGMPLQRRQAARDVRARETFGGARKICHDAEAAEALAEHAPALDAELAPDRLRVEDNRVGAEMREVLGLLLRGHAGEVAGGSGTTGAALVEQQHPELLQSTLEPGLGHSQERARGLVAGSALEVDEPGQVVPLALDGHDFAREHGQLRPVRISVVDRKLELVLAEDEPRGAVGRDTHHARFSYVARGASATNSGGACGPPSAGAGRRVSRAPALSSPCAG
jgi:hypothetical protein